MRKCALVGLLALSLGGCVTQPVPAGYSGPLAKVQDTFAKRSDRSVDIFYLAAINGKKIDNAVVFRSRLDMSPENMAEHTGALEPLPPSEPGVYAWYFDEVPPGVPTDGCHQVDGSWLLYVGISPKKPSSAGKASKQDLRKRLSNHYSGNASGSTLRLTLGSLLGNQLGIQLQPVRGRLTFGSGEDQLSEWMAEHARVTWVTDPEPWILEDHLIETLSLPLNLQGNAHHPFQATLAAARRDARSLARQAAVSD